MLDSKLNFNIAIWYEVLCFKLYGVLLSLS